MFCRVCGQPVYENAVVCLNCGCDPRNGDNFCPTCGKQKTNPLQVVCLHCGTSLARAVMTSEAAEAARFKHKDKKLPAALLAFFLGGLGIHCFFLDNTNKGMTMLFICLFGLFFFLLGPLITGVWAFVDFIRILCMSDKEFERFVDKKQW